MKKTKNYIIGFLIVALIAFIYYYITLPAVNIHSKGFWFFVSFAILVLIGIVLLKAIGKQGKIIEGNGLI